MKMRKCDKPKAAGPKPPGRLCCPVCSLPACSNIIKDGDLKKVAPCEEACCEFFSRCANIKMDEEKGMSGAKRSELFRQYHADICPICKRDVVVCHKLKIKAVKAAQKRLVKKGAEDDAYLEPDQIKKRALAAKCKPPDQRKYTPVPPSWYVP